MPDFVPDDIDEYMKRHDRIDKVINTIDSEEVDEAAIALGESAIELAERLVLTGNLDPQEALVAVTGTVAGILAGWYAERDEDEDDG